MPQHDSHVSYLQEMKKLVLRTEETSSPDSPASPARQPLRQTTFESSPDSVYLSWKVSASSLKVVRQKPKQRAELQSICRIL